jgi:hypothetical protein
VDRLAVSTVVYRPPEEVYDFLLEFTRYPRYSRYLKTVDLARPPTDTGGVSPSRGTADAADSRTHETDGGAAVGVGAEYDFRLAWWKLGCTMRSRVVDAVRPERVGWRVIDGPEAAGHWRVEPAPEAAERECVPAAARVRLAAEFDPDTVDVGALTLPEVLEFDWAVAQVKPLLAREVERMVVRAVRDLEGDPREVTITVEEWPDLDLV